MAKDVIGEVAQYGILAAVAYAGYGLALNGHFGLAAQQAAQSVHSSLKGQGLPGVSVAPNGPPSTPQPAHQTPSAPSGDHSAALSAMIIHNPNFLSQAVGWRGLRSQRGQDPNDWSAFELYQTQIGAPDPGGTPPPEWPNDPSVGGPMSFYGSFNFSNPAGSG